MAFLKILIVPLAKVLMNTRLVRGFRLKRRNRLFRYGQAERTPSQKIAIVIAGAQPPLCVRVGNVFPNL
jgi:hypothetical protein